MSDKPPAQIIDLSAAFKQRLTGEVAAPGAPGDIRVDPDAAEWCPSCGAHWPVDEKHDLVEKLATSVERYAIADYLYREAMSGSWSKAASMVLVTVSARIRTGEHA